MLSFIIGSLVFGFMGLDFESAIGVAASSLGNVGPAIGDLVLPAILVNCRHWVNFGLRF